MCAKMGFASRVVGEALVGEEEGLVAEEEDALVQATRALLRKACLSLHDFFAGLAEGVCEAWCEGAGQRVSARAIRQNYLQTADAQVLVMSQVLVVYGLL